MDDRPTRQAVTAERALLKGLGGGCQVPVGALAVVDDNYLRLQGIVIQVDGKKWLTGETVAKPDNAYEAGLSLANTLLEQGAKEILDCGR